MNVHIKNKGITIQADGGDLLTLLRKAGLAPDAPCGGNGTCGKCKVLVDGKEQLACKTLVDRDMEVELPQEQKTEILEEGVSVTITPDGTDRYVLAFDVGTTTLVGYLLDGITGKTLAQVSCVNPQTRFGADVISRIQYAFEDPKALSESVLGALRELTLQAAAKANIQSEEITVVSLVGNTAMHHLLLEIDPKPLTTPPYMPSVSHALELSAKDYLPVAENAVLRVLPNIAGFVGADTVGCMTALRFDKLEELTLMIDIGTNGEMVLGDKNSFLACSTAAGPAFEGAKIQCGMRGAVGAVDHVHLEEEALVWSVIGGGTATGICGSGLLDLVACLLAWEDIDETGRLEETFTFPGTEVFLSQKDVREVQLAKAAIRAGIELMCKKRGVAPEEIRHVYLAGAFGNYLDPQSACAIGMIPPVLADRIQGIGNAAGQGARLCALSKEEFAYSQRLAEKTEFLELASMPEFNDCYVDCLLFEEEDD